MAERDVVGLDEVDRTQVALVGGKGAGLGELRRVDGVVVPDGFCVTTAAFRRVVGQAGEVTSAVARLSGLDPSTPEGRQAIAVRGAAVRAGIEAIALPDDLRAEVAAAVGRMGAQEVWAVRSSATAEDRDDASAAGQQDTFLDVVGVEAVAAHVVRCWASLFTDRAVAYRTARGIDHASAAMAVVVQRMVPARASGVLFTADPVSGHRRVSTVEAVAGLGEGLVSGLVTPEVHTVRDGTVTTTAPADHRVLADAQVLELERLGRRIEQHLGAPQDIEWCLDGDALQVVQSRPITTLFPVPDAEDDARHVYLSVGHQQMMTDAMRPLGLSVWQMTTPRPMVEAGGRLFVDVTDLVAVPATREPLLALFGRSDPLVVDAVRTAIGGGGVVATDAPPPPARQRDPEPPIDAAPEVVAGLVERTRTSLACLREAAVAPTGVDVFAFVRDDIEELRTAMAAPDSHAVIMSAFEASWWVNDRMEEWLGVTNAADALTRSVPHNVTSEMGLALLDVADVVRPHAEVVAFLEGVAPDAGPAVLDRLADLSDGGAEVAAALGRFLDLYGMRCVGEIDITRTRWSEAPGALVPMILGHVAAFAPGEAARHVERGRAEAAAAEHDLLERVRALPDGEARAVEAGAMIDRVRAFAGYREHPKYAMVSRYAVYKEVLLREADRLVAAGVLADRDDVTFLRFDELEAVVRDQRVDAALVAARRARHAVDARLTAPRVLTSDGEALQGSFHRDDLPPGAIAGLGVSAGVVEGRARVVTEMGDADLVPGDILVTRFTDPSWSPVFLSITGLVTEVGGRTTHGAVIAREYGLPAVVGVEGATTRIVDGQRLRIDGTRGSVELLA